MRDNRLLGSFVLPLLIAVLVVLLLVVMTAGAQEPLRPSGRIAPGPDSTPTPTPTATPVPPVQRECKWVQTPWGGSACDVREVCVLNLMPMQIGTPRTTYGQLMTDATKVETEKLIASEVWPVELKVDWPSALKFAEWYIRASGEEYSETPLMGCYCDEKRNVIVICLQGVFDHEVE